MNTYHRISDDLPSIVNSGFAVVFSLWIVIGASACSDSVAHSEALSSEQSQADANVLKSGGESKSVPGGFTGVGWSLDSTTPKATREALDHALGDNRDAPDVALVYYNPQHSAEEIVQEVRSRLPHARIFGETSHEGILTSTGYHSSPTGVVGVLALKTPWMKLGIGGARFEGTTPGEAAIAALRQAREDAGAEEGEDPAMVVLSVTLPHEEAVLEALSAHLDKGVPVVGGTAAGTVEQLNRKRISSWSIVVNDEVITKGVGVACFFTPLEFAWSYGGGFRRTGHSGVVTRAEGRLIHEIDGRPASEVYESWLGGKVAEARTRGENIVKFCSLYPVATRFKEMNRFVRAWPSDDTGAPGSLRTGSTIKEGERIFLSEGTWNLLLNQFSTVPKKAIDAVAGFKPSAGLFLYCGGSLACIPDESRPQMGHLVSRALGDLPWIGVFTWGEQGRLRGTGIMHANLSSCTVLFPTSSD